jgi:large subunit ribosomal protein L24
MNKIKINDEVIVLSGKNKGKIGKIKSINEKTNMVLVEGVNLKTKSLRPTQENNQGGLTQVERPLHRSKISCICPKTKKPTRVGIKILSDGQKVRVAKKSGEKL